MVVEILKHKPEQIHDFMIDYLQKDKATLGTSEVNSLANAYGEYSEEEDDEHED